MTAWQVIGMLVGAVVLIYMASQFLREPGAALMNLLRGVIVGVVAILLINLIGQPYGFHIALNPFTAALTGLLGLPGVAALAAIHIWVI